MARPKTGEVVHVELWSKTPKETKRFFSTVFDWKFTEIPEMDYATFEAPGGPGGGIMAVPKGTKPDVLNYLLVPSVDTYLKKIAQAGGKIRMPKQEIPKMGWFAIAEAPGGIGFAIYQSARKR